MLEQVNIHMQKKEPQYLALLSSKSNSKWIIDLNIEPKPYFQKKTQEKIDHGLGKDFLNKTQNHKLLRLIKLDLFRAKNICPLKDTVKKINRPAID